MAYRQKINSKNPYRKTSAEPVSPKGEYSQFVDNVAGQVTNAMESLRYDYEKALADTIDGLLGTLIDFQTCAWVLENSNNRDAFRQAKNVESLYSSSREALISMALSAVEQDVIDVLGGKEAPSIEEGDTQANPIFDQKTRPYPINEPSTKNLRIPQ